MALEVDVARRLFTVEEYHRMAEAGILGEDERVELIDGEIVQMAPIGTRHIGCVINANRLFVTRLGDSAVISPQNPVVKGRLYARAGIAEFWLCLVGDGVIEIDRGPGADGYADVTQHGAGQRVAPLAFPDVTFAVSDFFA